MYGDSPRLDKKFPGRIVSYKVDIVPMHRAVEDTSIVYFHGEPKPHIINENWIQENWK